MTTKEKIVIKVQLPLATNGSNDMALVYNEDRSFMQALPLRSKKELNELRNQLGDEMKGYFYAEKRDNGLIITEPAPWQSW